MGAARGLCLAVASGGCSPGVLCGLLTAVASLAAERRLRGRGPRAQLLHGCAIFPDTCPLYWQADSYAQDQQGSPSSSCSTQPRSCEI